MKKFEIIMGLATIVGIAFRLLDISGGLVIIAVSLSILACFYWIFSFALLNDIRLRDIFKKASYKDTNPKRIIGAIVTGFILSNIVIGCMFKVQVWQGSDPILKIALPVLGLILLVSFGLYSRSKSDFYIRVMKRVMVCGGLGLILYLTPASTFINAFDIPPDEEQSIEEVTTDTNVDEAELD
jgi:hypothetical protein